MCIFLAKVKYPTIQRGLSRLMDRSQKPCNWLNIKAIHQLDGSMKLLIGGAKLQLKN